MRRNGVESSSTKQFACELEKNLTNRRVMQTRRLIEVSETSS